MKNEREVRHISIVEHPDYGIRVQCTRCRQILFEAADTVRASDSEAVALARNIANHRCPKRRTP